MHEYSREIRKGAVSFQPDGRALIRFFEHADASTIVHEMAHIFRRDLFGEDLAIAEDWVGVSDGVWTVEAEEKFARGFERYVREREAPTAELVDTFTTMRAALTEVYPAVSGSEIDIELSDEIVGVYARLLGGGTQNDGGAYNG